MAPTARLSSREKKASAVFLSVLGPYLLGHATDVIFAGVIGRKLPAGITQDQAVEGLRARGEDTQADLLNGVADLVPRQGIATSHPEVRHHQPRARDRRPHPRVVGLRRRVARRGRCRARGPRTCRRPRLPGDQPAGRRAPAPARLGDEGAGLCRGLGLCREQRCANGFRQYIGALLLQRCIYLFECFGNFLIIDTCHAAHHCFERRIVAAYAAQSRGVIASVSIAIDDKYFDVRIVLHYFRDTVVFNKDNYSALSHFFPQRMMDACSTRQVRERITPHSKPYRLFHLPVVFPHAERRENEAGKLDRC